MHFESMGLSPVLLRALQTQGFTTPTPIQSQAIPLVLQGRDLMGSAPTGTGKTAAFALPMLERLLNPAHQPAKLRNKRPRALVLTPTRELAAQVHASARNLAKGTPLRGAPIFGGVGMHGQLRALQQGIDFLVATPGRLIDHLQRGSVDLRGVQLLVLDEADRMLDMGFLPALKKILAELPGQRQTLLFSATFDGPVKALAMQFLQQPETLQVTPPNRVTDTVSHRVHPVDASRKRELLLHILAQDSRRQTLVFGRTKYGCDKLVRYLEKSGLRAAAIHGNKSQSQRTRALKQFKNHRVTVLVATDIAARGLDIEQLPLVINHDLPMVAADYVHRIGRTGRAGASGLAVSLVSQAEATLLRDIQKLLDKPIEIEPVEGFEPDQPLRLPTGKGKAKSATRKPKPGQGRGRPSRRRKPAGTAALKADATQQPRRSRRRRNKARPGNGRKAQLS